MSIFSFLRGTDINQAIHNCRQTPGAALPRNIRRDIFPEASMFPFSLWAVSAVWFPEKIPLYSYTASPEAAAGRPRAFWDRWAIPVCKTQEVLCPTPVRL